MKERELAQAKDPDLRGSLQAIQRAAELARKTAIQTDTGIVIFEGERIVHLSAQVLRRENAA